MASSPQRGSCGASAGPVILVGHTCRVCSDAIDHVGSVGPTSLERSLVAHVAPDLLPKLGWDNVRVDGIHGWAITAHEDPSVPD